MSHPASKRTGAFTLVELVLAIAMASVFLVGIFTVMSSGLTSSQDASTDARVSLILRDVSQRLRGVEFVKADQTTLVPAFPTLPDGLYYDRDGRWLDQTDATKVKNNVYKVVVKKGWPLNKPANTNMMAVVVEVYWPVEPKSNGLPLPTTSTPKPKARFSYQVAPMTGRGWADIDPNYIPKIEG